VKIEADMVGSCWRRGGGWRTAGKDWPVCATLSGCLPRAGCAAS